MSSPVGPILRKLRILVSVLFLLLSVILLNATGATLALSLGWVAKIQLFPMALAGAITGLCLWLAATLLFGRIYCSSVCPLGTTQDILTRLPRLTKKSRRKRPVHFAKANNSLRYLTLGAVGACVALGGMLLPSLLDPWSNAARISGQIPRLFIDLFSGGNFVAGSLIGAGFSILLLAALGVATWKRGRIFCNTLCPVGSTLGILSRASLFHFDIDTDVCTNCRRCEYSCKAQCINMADHTVDASRCVVCFDCIDSCSTGAIRYTTDRKRLSIPMMQRITPAAPTSSPIKIERNAKAGATANQNPKVKIDRRQFMATGLLVALSPKLDAVAHAADRIASPAAKPPLRPLHPIAPPGRRSLRTFLEKCTGCGLCIAHCPHGALRPSSNQYGWLNMLHPVMDYNRGYCEFDCTRCTDLCPSGALKPLTVDEKHIFIIGHARVDAGRCIGCGRCARNCPKQTITMIPNPHNPDRRIAAVNTSDCIGCGKCQYVCPLSQKAIIVDGII